MYSIRPATAADIDAVLHHRRAMFHDMGYTDATALDSMVTSSRSYFGSALASGAYRGWMAESEEGKVVGGGGIIVMAWPGNPRDPRTRRAMILNMYVEPEFRRRAIARALMRAMIDWCRGEGFRTVELHASDAGRPLYEALGFEPTNEMRLVL